MRIKARLLLPRKEVNEEGEEIDPREELTAMLLEYKRYKDVLDDFKGMEEQRSKQEKRGNISKELKQIATKALVDLEIKEKDRAHFDFVFQGLENRTHAIVTFLALMDLLNMQMVRLVEGEGINNFWLTLA